MIKRFQNFVYESKYDSFAFSVANDLLEIVKQTSGTKPGRAIHQELIYSEPLEFSLNFIVKRVIQFNPSKSIHFKNLQWEILNFEDTGFALDTNAYIPKLSENEEPEIEMILYISPNSEPKSYQSLSHKLIDHLRHEMEHLLQFGINQRPGHIIKTPLKFRYSADTPYRYFLLSDEIPAMVAGLRAAALKKKIPISQEFELHLMPFLKSGLLTDPQFKKIMRVWMKFANQVYSNNS